jgi:hypothetical protein
VGVLQRFERRLEDLVGGTFARLFKGQVEPVEIAKALQREAEENRAAIGSAQVLAPNRYLIELGPSDYDRLSPWERQLTRTLAEMVQEFVDDQGWSTYGDVAVSFALDETLRTGVFRVGSDVNYDVGPRQRPREPLSAPLEPINEPINEPANAPPWAAQAAPARQPANAAAHPIAPPPMSTPPPMGVPSAGPPPAGPVVQRREPAQPGLYEPPPRVPVLLVDGTDRRLPVHPGSTLIGRGQEADLRLADTGVSRRHAVVRFDGRTAVIEDLNSTNGTTVNGQRIRTWRLQSDDVIKVGHTVVVFRQEPWGNR